MSQFAFMEEVATGLDTAVAEFVDGLPAGDGTVGCFFLWHMFETSYDGSVSPEEFEASAALTGRTIDVYGRQYVGGVDADACRQMHIEAFDLLRNE